MSDNFAPTIQLGVYQHYKGPYYEVQGLVRHSETEEWLVLYRCCYGDWALWVRPHTMFTENIEWQGGLQPRFAYTGKTLCELGLLNQSHG